jgi:hypothetical protein
LPNKLGITFEWRDEEWQDYYYLGGTNIIDAAVLWERGSYISNTFMCVSFQYPKTFIFGPRWNYLDGLAKKDAIMLEKMSYDGRLPNIPWRDQDI